LVPPAAALNGTPAPEFFPATDLAGSATDLASRAVPLAFLATPFSSSAMDLARRATASGNLTTDLASSDIERKSDFLSVSRAYSFWLILQGNSIYRIFCRTGGGFTVEDRMIDP
jgi:hypothetical protein